MQQLAKFLDTILSKFPVAGPWLNNRKTLLGAAGFVIVSILHQTGLITADTALTANEFLTYWSGVGIIHKGAKLVL